MKKTKKRTGNPQPDDGCAHIAHELMEAIARSDLTKSEHSVLYVVLDKTYGWKKKEDWISVSLLSKITGISPEHCSRAVCSLLAKNMLIRRMSGKQLYLGLNKHHLDWTSKRAPLPQVKTRWRLRPQPELAGTPQPELAGTPQPELAGYISTSTETLGTEVVINAREAMNPLPPAVVTCLEESLGSAAWNEPLLRIVTKLLDEHGEDHFLRACDEATIHLIPPAGFLAYVRSVLTEQKLSGYTWKPKQGGRTQQPTKPAKPLDPVIAWAEELTAYRDLVSISSRNVQEEIMRSILKESAPGLSVDVATVTPHHFFLEVYRHLGYQVPAPIPADA